ncbi:hypothetical protein N7462_006655 [Penicillium macrosclerotiorum]|uniref:uncharacterized protein n=1 Tax=Penicillium macrosclerotiorum TaxID=303699 RepID=UPI002547873E|nr:uncharacterized protein N7462_006655 [Penicillium macrosclerotiorum]KAJ5683490.1 hypothetical protein N7462_006655 [Penicillium macrosclerotiorum]
MDMSMATTTTANNAMSSTTATATSASSTSTLSMEMSMGNSCKISMLWNWNTVDSCFIAESWQITSNGMFAGSCIGVICLVISLEFLRRLGKEYDRSLLRTHTLRLRQSRSEVSTSVEALSSNFVSQKFTPTILQQSIRAFLHMVQFAVAYFVMLLAMYYNGYIIICIFIGAYIGSFIFSWEPVNLE